MDKKLLDILACPNCKGDLEFDKKAQELICKKEKLAYPVRDGIPILISTDARSLV